MVLVALSWGKSNDLSRRLLRAIQADAVTEPRMASRRACLSALKSGELGLTGDLYLYVQYGGSAYAHCMIHLFLFEIPTLLE